MSEFPIRPSDIGTYERALPRLARRLHEHRWAVLGKAALDGSMTPEQYRAHALAALAYGHALAEEATAGQWVTAVEALAAGATLEQVAAALNVHVDDLPVLLAARIAEQRRLGLVDDDCYEQVMAVIREAVRS